MPTEKSLANLKPHRFKTGNKAGRGNPLLPKINKLRAALVAAVTQADIERIAKRLVTEAEGGDVAATHELLDRLFGKAKESIELTGAGGGPVKMYSVVSPDDWDDDAGTVPTPPLAGGAVAGQEPDPPADG